MPHLAATRQHSDADRVVIAKARTYSRRMRAAMRRHRCGKLTLSDKARQLQQLRDRGFAPDLAWWFGRNGEIVRSELRSWGAAA